MAVPITVTCDINYGITALASPIGQRSRVHNVSLLFSEAVSVYTGGVAIVLHTDGVVYGGTSFPSGMGSIACGYTLSTSGDKRFTYTFNGSAPDGLFSLPDGVYKVLVNGLFIHPISDPSANGPDFKKVFHCLFGDQNEPTCVLVDGNTRHMEAVVNTGDNMAFLTAKNGQPNSYRACFDYDGNGTINTADQQQQQMNFGHLLEWVEYQ